MQLTALLRSQAAVLPPSPQPLSSVGMATDKQSYGLHASDITVSDQARLHVGHNIANNYYVDTSQLPPGQLQKLKEDAILSSLAFPEMNARVPDKSCEGTYDWIFDNEVITSGDYNQNEVPNLLPTWLAENGGVFFISGKAGSGKSTFMRYLANHQRTEELLTRWAQDAECSLAMASFFFWYSGTALQKSREGLWRSLLFQVLRQNRSLIPLICHSRLAQGFTSLDHLSRQAWPAEDLWGTMEQLIAQVAEKHIRLCIFVDGLDEYIEDEWPLIENLEALVKTPFIKVCCSSRPRNLFEHTFVAEERRLTLVLDQYTTEDIRQTVTSCLQNAREFGKLSHDDPRMTFCIDSVSERAEGVFLWAVLVAQEIIREVRQLSTVPSVKKLTSIINALPVGLGGAEGLFHMMITRSDPRYTTDMARLLLIMLHRLENPTEATSSNMTIWEEIHFLYKEHEDPGFMFRGCMGLDEEFRKAWDDRTGESDDSRSMGMRIGVTPYCPCLFIGCSSHSNNAVCEVLCGALVNDARLQTRKRCPDFIDTTEPFIAQFTHRSIVEYLALPEARDQLFALAGQSFNILSTRCRLLLACARLRPVRWELGDHIRDLMGLAGAAESLRGQENFGFLDSFERIMTTDWLSWAQTRASKTETRAKFWANNWAWYSNDMVLEDNMGLQIEDQSQAWFLAHAARVSLTHYVRYAWLKMSASKHQSIGTIILCGLVFPFPRRGISGDHVEFAKTLLSSGVSPNVEYFWYNEWDLPSTRCATKLTFWEAYIMNLSDVWSSDDDLHVRSMLDTMMLLLDVGHANPASRLPNGHKTLFSAIKPPPRRKMKHQVRQDENWEAHGQSLLRLLSDRGLLSEYDKLVIKQDEAIGEIEAKEMARRFKKTTPY